MNITKATLTYVFSTDKDKEGKPLLAKASGKPYTRMSIKCVEYGEKYLSGFQCKDNANWKEGDVVDIIVKTNGEYLNFDVPKAEDRLGMRISAMEVDIQNLKTSIARMSSTSTGKVPVVAQVSVPSNPAFEQEPDF